MIIRRVLEFSYLENTGAAFSSFAGRQTLLICLTTLVTLLLVWKYLTLPGGKRFVPMRLCMLLIISGADGVQGHTLTLWRLLERYQVPVFLFINKMDQKGTDKEFLMGELKKRLHENCVDFGGSRVSSMWADDAVPRDKDPVSRSSLGYLKSCFTESTLILVPLVNDSTRKLAYILKSEGLKVHTVHKAGFQITKA